MKSSSILPIQAEPGSLNARSRTVTILKTSLLFLLVLPVAAQNCYDPQGFAYQIEGIITGYNGPGGNLVIPNLQFHCGAYGEPIVGIGDGAFQNGNLTAIKMPSSVQTIGASAFKSCSNLTTATISGHTIGDHAFEFCTGLKKIYFTGIPPNLGGPNVFAGATNATAYFLPEHLSAATQFGQTFGGLPTAVWRPLAETGDGVFGVRTNQFGFNVRWSTGRGVVVEVSTNLTNPTWLPIQTNTLTQTPTDPGDSFFFSDSQWTNHPSRFYRLRAQ